jgi:signal transduction histidine kinase/CheY-like chemotaxis protein
VNVADTHDGETETAHRTAVDVAVAVAAALATAALFAIDCTQPRGVLDGIGYPAVVAVSARFGRGPLLGTALFCSLLIAGAHFLVPDAGISVAGELANRLFGLASIWIIAGLLQRRLRIEESAAGRAAILRRYQTALARIMREALVKEQPFSQRMRCVTEIAGEAVGADLTGIFRFHEGGLLMRSVDTWQRDTHHHFKMIDIRTQDTPGYDRLEREDYTIVIKDMEKMPPFGARPFVDTLGIRATLTVGVLAGSELAGQIIFAVIGRPRAWTEQDIAFARAAGSLVTTLFAGEQRDLLEARLRQAAKMEAIGQLAGGVAHDFNNILGAIMGFAGFLMQDLAEESEQHAFASRIMAASHRGKELVDQILMVARARGPDADSADLGRAVQQTLDLVRDTFAPAVVLDVATQADTLWVRCGAAKLSQLLLNLFIHARDAVGPGPGTVRLAVTRAAGAEIERLAARHDAVELSVGEPDFALDYACVQISDTAGGIAPDNLKRIFEPFYSTKDRPRGAGLGLAVVQGVIETCGGFCHVRTIPGVGTQFAIYLPLAHAGTEAAPPEREAPVRGSERVLVVDDEPDIVDAMVIGLERLGYIAVGVSDPQEALAAFAEDPQAFDIVVTDLAMPSLRGTELIRKIKAIRPGIRAILCTAFSDGIRTGADHKDVADASFRKPVNAVAISACIRALMRSHL